MSPLEILLSFFDRINRMDRITVQALDYRQIAYDQPWPAMAKDLCRRH